VHSLSARLLVVVVVKGHLNLLTLCKLVVLLVEVTEILWVLAVAVDY
jgi:hypothetical protein